MSPQSTPFEDAMAWARIDFSPRHRQPSTVMVVVAITSIIGSLAADAALVAIGTALFPSTKGYVHFRFSDYAKLTIIGVVIAAAGLADHYPDQFCSAVGCTSGWPFWSPSSSSRPTPGSISTGHPQMR